MNAAERVVEQARQIAASQLEVTLEDVVAVEGGFSLAGVPTRRVSWQEVVDGASRRVDRARGEDGSISTSRREMWPFGTHLAVVRIDRETGLVHIDRIVAVDDCGNVVNPLIVEGRFTAASPRRWARRWREQVIFDADGQLMSGSLGDYAVPRAATFRR